MKPSLTERISSRIRSGVEPAVAIHDAHLELSRQYEREYQELTVMSGTISEIEDFTKRLAGEAEAIQGHLGEQVEVEKVGELATIYKVLVRHATKMSDLARAQLEVEKMATKMLVEGRDLRDRSKQVDADEEAQLYDLRHVATVAGSLDAIFQVSIPDWARILELVDLLTFESGLILQTDVRLTHLLHTTTRALVKRRQLEVEVTAALKREPEPSANTIKALAWQCDVGEGVVETVIEALQADDD